MLLHLSSIHWTHKSIGVQQNLLQDAYVPTKQELAAFKARLIEAIQKLERTKKTRLSQVQLAERWGTSQGSVSRWLDAKGIPEREMIGTIAKDCDVDPGWLHWGTQPAQESVRVDGVGAAGEKGA